jgi:hypothetical protein
MAPAQAHEKVRGRGDHDDGQAVDRGDDAGRDAHGEQLRRQGIVGRRLRNRSVAIPP